LPCLCVARAASVCLIVLVGAVQPMNGQPVTSSVSRFDTVRSRLYNGRYADAEAEAETLFATVEAATDTPPSDVGRIKDLLVEALVRNGKGAEPRTRALAEQLVRAKTAPSGTGDPTLATSLRNLGDVMIQAGEYETAIEIHKRAVVAREAAPGTDVADVADDLDHLARALALVERHDEALTTADRALEIKEKIFDHTDVRIAETLEIHGLVLQQRGDYSRARAALERSLALREVAYPAHPAVARTLSLLADQYWLEGRLIEARQFSGRAVAIAEKSLRPDHPDLALYLKSLAVSVADLGDLAGARALRERALAIAEKSLGSDHPAVALQVNDLAMSLGQQGEYSTARLLFERALRTYERLRGPDDSGATTAVYNLAIVSKLLGDVLEARRYFNRAIATWERVLGADHPFVAYAVSALAETASEQGLDAEARTLYERALTIREKKLGKDHRDVARTLSNLSTSVAKLGQLQEAYELSTRAIDIWERSGARDTKGAAEALVVHGTLQASLGDYRAAGRSYDRALTILRQVLDPSHPDIAFAQVSLAEALAYEGQSAEAIGNALAAEEIGRAHLRLTLRYLPERQALGFVAKRAKGLDLALSLSETNTAPTALLFDRLVRARALILDEMAARHHDSADDSTTQVAALWTTLTASRQRLANLVVKGPGQQRPEQYHELVDTARREKELAERALAEKSTPFRDELARTEIGLDQVRAALPTDTALLSFVRYDRTVVARTGAAGPGYKPPIAARPYPAPTVPSYIAFVLRSGESNPTAVPLGDAEAIDKLVSQWRTQVVTGLARSPGSPMAVERSLRIAGARVRRRIWDPIAKHTGDASRVYVVPDGSLNLVPLVALPIGEKDYLLEKGPILHYLSAERDLLSTGASSNVGQGLLAVGRPSFDDAALFTALATRPSSRQHANAQVRPQAPVVEASAEQQSEPVTGATPFRGLGPNCASFQSLRFEVLPASGREANDVANLWKEFGPDAAGELRLPTILTGRDANEKAFKQLGAGRRVLHLATHGFFLGSACTSALDGTRAVGGLVSGKATKPAARKPASAKPARPLPTAGENPLLLSGLALAGANRRAAASADEEDGILTAEEVASLNLEGVEWAVLSACDTGLGEIKAGEGVFGLRRAFQVAGARTVIMSLWSVEDRSAMEWMRALYEARLRRGLNTADAVREASLTVLRQRRARGQSVHPFFWAGFVASGDWR
jgi:CHAT domain-containing protein/tetratricopeptide (TPR) repeat protein